MTLYEHAKTQRLRLSAYDWSFAISMNYAAPLLRAEAQASRSVPPRAGSTSLQSRPHLPFRVPTRSITPSLAWADQQASPETVREVISSPGDSLSDSVRRVFEARLGSDLESVRIHTDSRAAASARSIGALAYTVGRNVVFDSGRYDPDSNEGQRLLAHELAHVVQQRAATAVPSRLEVGTSHDPAEREAWQVVNGRGDLRQGEVKLRRACGPRAIGEPAGCTAVDGDVVGDTFLFRVNCDEFRKPPQSKTDEAAHFDSWTGTVRPGDTVELHGFASEEGDPGFNLELSCARAHAAAAVARRRAPGATYILFSHGGVPGPRDERRSVVAVRRPTPPEQKTTGDDTKRTVEQPVKIEKRLPPDEVDKRAGPEPTKGDLGPPTPAPTREPFWKRHGGRGWGFDLQLAPGEVIGARDLYNPSDPGTPLTAPRWRRGARLGAGDVTIPINFIVLPQREGWLLGGETVNVGFEPQAIATVALVPRAGALDQQHAQLGVALAMDILHWKVSEDFEWHIVQSQALGQVDIPFGRGNPIVGGGVQAGTGIELALPHKGPDERFTLGANLNGQALWTSDGAFSLTLVGSLFITWHIQHHSRGR